MSQSQAPTTSRSATVAIVGGGAVGTALLYTLAHRGVDAVLFEAESELGLSASGTNSGILHTGFDSTPGELETELILRAAKIRPVILEQLGVPTIECGAVLVPKTSQDADVIRRLAENATINGIETTIRDSDGALLVPGESVCDPVAYVAALAASAVIAGAQIELDARVTAITPQDEGLTVHLANGTTHSVSAVINAAGLYADEVARLVGDESFEIYPRKGEFFVFDLPPGQTLKEIVLPVPTKRTKGVLVFPTIDGKVIAGPTAIDLHDKEDWSVRASARDDILAKAVQQFPDLAQLEPVAAYAGLRPAGRNSNYVIGPSAAQHRLINVAAIRSTGLTASLGIADYVAEFLPSLGIEVIDMRAPEAPRSTPVSSTPASSTPTSSEPASSEPWWVRSATYRSARRATGPHA